jgi:flagellar assembly factor FliW
MPWCNTTHFGRLEYSPASAIEFSEGLPGFETERRFVVVQRPDHHPLVFLQSLQTQRLCFPALPVRAIDSSYELRIGSGDREALGFENTPRIGEDALALALIALHEEDPTANLLAPIVINLRTQAAAQCIDPDMRYSHRYQLAAALEIAS